MEQTTVRKCKPGEYVKLVPSEKAPVWVRTDYDRSSKTYWLKKFDDVCAGLAVKGDRTVYVGFTF